MDTPPEITTLAGGPALAIRAQVAIADLPGFFGGAFAELFHRAGGQAAGPPFARYHRVGPVDTDVEVIVPVRARVSGEGRVHAIDLEGGPAVQIRHVGPYDQLHTTYEAVDRWIADHHRERADAVREVYLTSPQEVPDPASWVTLVIQPLRDQPAR
jgi:effector-binding domain-containing protein